MVNRPNRRKILVIEPGLQFRYLIFPLVVTLTTGACLFALFVIQAESLRAVAGSDDLRLQQQIRSVQIMNVIAVPGVLLGHVGLIVWLGLAASHKVAGPVYRLKQAMKQVAEGDMTTRITLRKGDQLTDVAVVFNDMMETLAAGKGPNGSIGAREHGGTGAKDPAG